MVIVVLIIGILIYFILGIVSSYFLDRVIDNKSVFGDVEGELTTFFWPLIVPIYCCACFYGCLKNSIIRGLDKLFPPKKKKLW